MKKEFTKKFTSMDQLKELLPQAQYDELPKRSPKPKNEPLVIKPGIFKLKDGIAVPVEELLIKEISDR